MPKPEIPVDPLTHFPLPFLPARKLPPMPPYGDMRYDPAVARYHHTVVIDRSLDKSDIGIQAVLDSRLQWVLQWQHRRYHDEWGDLDEHFPGTRARQCHTAVFTLGEYIPEQGIDFSTGDPTVVTMSRRDREQFRRNKHFVLGNSGVRIRRFLLEYGAEQGISTINPKRIDELIDLVSRRRRPERARRLADSLLEQTIDPMVTPGMSQIYTYTRRHEMLRPGLPSALGALIQNEIRLAFAPERLAGRLAYLFSTLRTAAA